MKNTIPKNAIQAMETLHNFFTPAEITHRAFEIQSLINQITPEEKSTCLFLTKFTAIMHEAEYLATDAREKVLLTKMLQDYTPRQAVDHCINAALLLNSADNNDDDIGDHCFYLTLILQAFRILEYPEKEKALTSNG